MEDLAADPTMGKADLIHVCETWLTEGEEDQLQFRLEGYESFFVSVGPGKGLVTFSKTAFQHIRDVKTPKFQMTLFSSTLLDSIHVYRSADGSVQDVRDFLEELINPTKSVLISGDFNICLDREPNNLITAYLQQQGFEQLVKEATHDDGGWIDHVYLKKTPELKADADLIHHHPYYTDHDALCFTLKAKVLFCKTIPLINLLF